MNLGNNGLVGFFIFSVSMFLIGCGEAPLPQVEAKSLHRYSEDVVLAAAMSDDAATVALLSANRQDTKVQQVAVWNNKTHKLLHRWDKKQLGDDELTHIAVSGDNKRLAVAGHWTVSMLNVIDGSVITVWDVQGFEQSAIVSKLHLDHTGHHVLVGMSDGAVLSVSLNNGNALRLDHHDNQITTLAYSKGHEFGVSGSSDKNLAYWRSNDGKVIFQQDFRSRITAMAVDNQTSQLFVSDALNSHWIINTSNGEMRTALNYFERFRYFRQAMFIDNGRYLVTSSPKDVMTLWHSATGDEVVSWNIKRFTSEASVWAMALNGAGELVTLSSDGAVQRWDLKEYF